MQIAVLKQEASRWSRRTNLLLTFCWLVACAGNEGALDAARCERMRDHLVDLELASTPEDALRESRGPILRRALGDEFISHCVSAMSEEQVACMGTALDSSAVAACKSQFTN